MGSAGKGRAMSPLQAAYDDPADPAELTLFSAESDSRPTSWLTIDVEHAVELRSMV